MGSRWPSSWRPPPSATALSPACSPGWPTGSRSSPMGVARLPAAIRPFAPLWSGASTCSVTSSGGSSPGSPPSPGAGRRTPSTTCAVAAPLDGSDLHAVLRRLIRASLVVAHPDVPGRWTMLESIRELAALELATVGEADELAARHRAWFATTGRGRRGLRGADRPGAGDGRPDRRPRQHQACFRHRADRRRCLRRPPHRRRHGPRTGRRTAIGQRDANASPPPSPCRRATCACVAAPSSPSAISS